MFIYQPANKYMYVILKDLHFQWTDKSKYFAFFF